MLAGGVGLAGLAVAGCAAPTATGGRPIPVQGAPALPGSPNLLVIFSDDHRADHLGLTGEILRDMYLGETPFIDVSPLDVRRFETGELRPEKNIV